RELLKARSAPALAVADALTFAVSESAGPDLASFASTAPLAALAPFGSTAATGCGATFWVGSSACAKVAGVSSPGVTTTRAPIRVQFHILMANAIGMRMQPCEAG